MNNTKQCRNKDCAHGGVLQSVRNFRIDGHTADGRRQHCIDCENIRKRADSKKKRDERKFYAQFMPI